MWGWVGGWGFYDSIGGCMPTLMLTTATTTMTNQQRPLPSYHQQQSPSSGSTTASKTMAMKTMRLAPTTTMGEDDVGSDDDDGMMMVLLQREVVLMLATMTMTIRTTIVLPRMSEGHAGSPSLRATLPGRPTAWPRKVHRGFHDDPPTMLFSASPAARKP